MTACQCQCVYIRKGCRVRHPNITGKRVGHVRKRVARIDLVITHTHIIMGNWHPPMGHPRLTHLCISFPIRTCQNAYRSKTAAKVRFYSASRSRGKMFGVEKSWELLTSLSPGQVYSSEARRHDCWRLYLLQCSRYVIFFAHGF